LGGGQGVDRVPDLVVDRVALVFAIDRIEGEREELERLLGKYYITES
jgi:hypothetical protein